MYQIQHQSCLITNLRLTKYKEFVLKDKRETSHSSSKVKITNWRLSKMTNILDPCLDPGTLHRRES
jgi:hypothetical protein